jgi:hypothetical protein
MWESGKEGINGENASCGTGLQDVLVGFHFLSRPEVKMGSLWIGMSGFRILVVDFI